MTSNIKVEVDWTKTGTWVDESGLVRPNMAPVQASYGRDQITALAPTVAGTGSFTLDNRTRRFSPRNTSSPLSGYLKPARPVRITRTVTGTAEQTYRTNYASNPKLGTATTYWSFSATGTGDAATLTRETSGGPAQASTYARITYSAASTLGAGLASGGLAVSLAATDPGLAVNPGERRSVLVLVRCSKAQRLVTTVQYVNGAGATILSTSGPQAVIAANTWTEFRLDQASDAPANTVRIRVLVFGASGTGAVNWAIADTLEATALCVVAGATSPGTYFDGGTAAGTRSYRWTGTTDASTSQEYTPAVADATYSLFTGHTDDNPINPDMEAKSVGLTLVDNLADFRGQNLSTQLYRGIRTGEAIGCILDACGWSASLRDIDPGATVIPWWWEDGTDALTALEKLVRSEGPPALLTMGAGGEVIFRDRHHRLLDSAALSSQQTWRASGFGLVMNKGFTYSEAWSSVINSATVSVDVRLPQATAVVWTSESTVSLAVGEDRLVTASASDPFYDAVTPVSGTDFTVVSGTAPTVTLLRTSGASATIKLSALVAAGTITGLQLRAKSVPVSYAVQVSASDTTSIQDYGARDFPGDLPWCGRDDAQAVLKTAVAQRAQPLPIVQARFVVGTDVTKFPLLGRDLSDRVTVVEDETSTDGAFHVENISHTLTGPLDHEVTFGVESVAEEPDNVLRAGDATTGAGVGVAGKGLSDPANIIIVGSAVAGHRVGEGVAAA